LDLKLNERQGREMLKYKLKELNLITLREGIPLEKREINGRHIIHAAQHPVMLDYMQAAAVNARLELDLRIGAAFTRFQTLTLQQRIGEIGEQKLIISYGISRYIFNNK
jgi:hypothetical protein